MIADVLARTAPVLVLLVAITVVAELSERARLPWRTVLVVLVLFVVQWLSDHGPAAMLPRRATARGSWPTGEWPASRRWAPTASTTCPHLALEPVADDSAPRLVSLLIGVNVGPLITHGPRSPRCCGASVAGRVQGR